MKIINKYIVKEFLWVYLVSISALSGFYLVMNIFESLKSVIVLQPSVYLVMMLYITQIPGIIYQTIPMAALLTTIIVYIVMSKNNEISTLLSTGISPFTIIKPAIVLILVLSMFHFMFGEYVVPRANTENAVFEAQIHHIHLKLSKNFKVNNIWFKSNDRIFKVGLFIPWLNTIKDITIYNFSHTMDMLVRRIDINTAKWNKGRWNADKLYIRDFSSGHQTGYQFSESALIRLPLTLSDFKHTGKTLDEMNYMELRTYIKRLKQEGYTYAPYDVALNAKLAYPLSSLFVILLVIPFALKKRKTSGMILALGVSIGVGLSYWIIMALSLSMGNSGMLNAIAAAWLPNIITFFAALIINGFVGW